MASSTTSKVFNIENNVNPKIQNTPTFLFPRNTVCSILPLEYAYYFKLKKKKKKSFRVQEYTIKIINLWLTTPKVVTLIN